MKWERSREMRKRMVLGAGFWALALAGIAGSAARGQTFGAATHDRTKPVQVVTFTATIHGISPPTMELAPGRYMFRLRNAVTKDAFSFTITDDRAARRAEIQIRRDQGRGHAFFDLDPGQYEIRTAGATGMRATITVGKP